MKKLFLSLAIFLFLGPLVATTFAEDSPASQSTEDIKLEYEKVNPDNTFPYAIKRIREKISLKFFSFSKNKKADYLESLSATRLAELKYVVDKKNMADFEVATKRYYTAAGDYSNFITKNNLGDKKEEAKRFLSSNIPLLKKLRDSFDYRTAEWRFMQDDVNYVKLYLQNLQ